MNGPQSETRDRAKSIRDFSIVVATEFEHNLVAALQKAAEGKTADLRLLELYASAGTADWALWELQKSTAIFPELSQVREQLEPQMDWLMMQLHVLELSFEGLDHELDSEMDQAITKLNDGIDTAILEENVFLGSFRFEEILILRDTIAYALQFLTTRLEFRKDLFLELDVLKCRRKTVRIDLKLKMNYSKLVEKYLYVELSSKAPEDFWWRRAFIFMQGPGAGRRGTLDLSAELMQLL